MNQKKRSPGVRAPGLQESKKCLVTLSRFGPDFNPNQGNSKDYIFPLYSEALAKAQADPSRENLENWAYWLKLLPPGLLSERAL